VRHDGKGVRGEKKSVDKLALSQRKGEQKGEKEGPLRRFLEVVTNQLGQGTGTGAKEKKETAHMIEGGQIHGRRKRNFALKRKWPEERVQRRTKIEQSHNATLPGKPAKKKKANSKKKNPEERAVGGQFVIRGGGKRGVGGGRSLKKELSVRKKKRETRDKEGGKLKTGGSSKDGRRKQRRRLARTHEVIKKAKPRHGWIVGGNITGRTTPRYPPKGKKNRGSTPDCMVPNG